MTKIVDIDNVKGYNSVEGYLIYLRVVAKI